MTYKTICKCDHDMATHYKQLDVNNGKRTSCLARGCECKLYRDSLEPEPAKNPPQAPPKTPRVPTWPNWP